jgi:hypothetical protein
VTDSATTMLRTLSGMGKDGAACFLDETRYR